MQWQPIGENQYTINCINEKINEIMFAKVEINNLVSPLVPFFNKMTLPRNISQKLSNIQDVENNMIANTKMLVSYIDLYKCQHGDVLDYFERVSKKPVN